MFSKSIWQQEIEPVERSPSNSTYHSSIEETEGNLGALPGIYAERASKLVQLVNQLRDVGAQVDLDLPTIVVCGNQSVGKSSIIEAICGISLPRGEGTCTRCVIEIRLTAKEVDWNCVVKLRKEYDANGMELSNIQETVFATLTSPNGLDDTILQAQKALLNPSVPISEIKKADPKLDRDDNELMFSQNVVCVEITGAKVDLTLIDLPGIIQSVGPKQEKRMIGLVNDLVNFYIAKQRSIILAVITCKDEIENQAIVHMAREVDPEGSRTIGVLTKPDTIEVGTHERWLQMLLGNSYPLKLGYFMVKLPSKVQMVKVQNPEDMFRLENEFFSTTAPWSSLKSRSDRFGIPDLRNELSRLLSVLIESSLPEMEHSTEVELQKVNQILDSLPPPIGEDGKIELLQTVRHFSTLVSYHINAQQNLKFETFRDLVMNGKPALVTDKSPQSSTNGSPSFWKRGDITPPSQKSSVSGRSFEVTIEDLRTIVNGQKGRELEGYSSYGAFEHMVKKFQQDWKQYATTLLINISSELSGLLTKLSEEVFGRFANLKGQIRFIVQLFQSDLQRITLEHLSHTLSMESRLPFTVNSSRFLKLKQIEMDNLLATLPEPALPTAQYPGTNRSESIKRALAALSEIGVKNLNAQTLISRVTTPFPSSDTVLYDLMASTNSYFEISSSRLIDHICQQIDYHFLSNFAELLEKELVHSLGILDKTNGEIAGLLKEDAGITEKRIVNQDKRERLENVRKSLHEFGYVF
ncbi:hypothetical protein HK103_002552 [Boothiomyces macroporosus]|uniref:P-loop containing nucleoside triphosphate hydrolase protein n=1 Tax=Boothiomyces macroporosus TaxID=261099 RepID=A0AAD5UCY2_9FUNG|nr:hypothetical protein HK103_002552 [Boothiomyces macroporosus]